MIAVIFEVAELSLERMWRRLSNWCQNKIDARGHRIAVILRLDVGGRYGPGAGLPLVYWRW